MNTNKKNEAKENYLKNLNELYEREKQARCYYQLERDKLMNIREIERSRYDEMKSELTLLKKNIDELECKHIEEMTNMQRKIRYLISERESKLNDLKNESFKKRTDDLKEAINKDSCFLTGIKSQLHNLNENATNFDELIKNIANDYENKISKINIDYSEAIKIIQNTSILKFKEERENFSLVTRNALNEMTELKNSQLESLKNIKNKCYDDLREYFQDLTKKLIESMEKLKNKNITINRSLKEKNSQLEANIKELNDFKKENNQIKNELKQHLATSNIYKSEKKIFKAKSIQFDILNKKYNDLDFKYEETLMGYEIMKKNHDKLYAYFGELVRIFKEKLDMANFLSNKKNELMENELRRYEGYFNDLKQIN
jgi:hypothetical protein